MPDVTQILNAIDAGDPRAASQLLPLVYDELRKLAAAQLANEKPGQTLNATALVHEAYLRLVGHLAPGESPGANYQNRGHFFAAAAKAMQRILVDRARARLAQKRGGDAQRLDVELDSLAGQYSDMEMVDTDAVLESLAAEDTQAAELVRLHVFAGLSVEEAGSALGMPRSTAYLQWNYARAWLRVALKK
jgi:RNA polymerase sigma factor (TIGR02999 family)